MKEQDTRKLTSFRIEKDLYIRLKTFLVTENLTMTDYLNDLIKTDLDKKDRRKS